MYQLQLRAMGKINLSLDVVRRREDGYHDVRMIMQTVRMFDRIKMNRIPEPEIRLSANLHFLPTGESNLAYRAAKLMMERHSIESGVSIDLQKYLPVSAGMAGGSTDAAAVLYGMNWMFHLGESQESLMDAAKGLGADVPYCLMRGTALAEGIGEKLTRLPPCPDCYVLLVKPPVSVSTKFVYENLHLDENTRHPDIDGMQEAIRRGDLKGVAALAGNVLESVTEPAYPKISELKKTMTEGGALVSMMSGSGPSVFGIFDEEEKAQAVYDQLRGRADGMQVFLTSPFFPRPVGLGIGPRMPTLASGR